MSAVHDVAIVGGGIVGMATALALSSLRSVKLVVLEAEDRLAPHQSGHNSGVIHSGLYYKPGSLKARNCVEGRKQLYRFCQEHAIPHERCGKLVVATSQSELPALAELERRGQANGLEGLRRVSREELRDHEPYVAGIAGLHVAETGIVDYVQVTQAYARIVTDRGGVIRTSTRLTSVARDGGDFVLGATQGEVRCKAVINCGGLYSDRVTRLCGLEPMVKIIPFRGEFYDLVPERKHLVRNLIYPVPNPLFPFLGVHFTRMITGDVECGPNAVLALKREGYQLRDLSPGDLKEMLLYGGFWKMAARYWKMGMGEMYRSLSKSAFVKALQRLLPELQASDLHGGRSGVRAQAVDPAGNLVDDFRIIEAERMIHVLNAPSPAATASLSIGQAIADMARKNFGLSD